MNFPGTASTWLAILLLMAAAWQPASAADPTPAALERAKRILERAPLIDAHNDLPTNLIELHGGDLTRIDLNAAQPTLAADIPRLRAGGVRAQYWSVWVNSATANTGTALHEALREFDVIHRMLAAYPQFELARSADDIERISRTDRIASLIGVEGGHMIEGSLAALRVFHQLGARYLTLTHWDSVTWADAATDRAEHDGLTEFGEQVVRELNRLGMFADISHVSADTMRDVLRVSRAPVIFSHSNAHALDPHPRNVPDDVLKSLSANGGVIHVNFIWEFVTPRQQQWRDARQQALRGYRAEMDDEKKVQERIVQWEKDTARPPVSIAEVADHIDHIRKVAGIDHIGIGADYYDDGTTSMVPGLENVTRYPYLFAELLARGYSEEDLMKIAGRNHLRAMRQMEQVAASLAKSPADTTEQPPPR